MAIDECGHAELACEQHRATRTIVDKDGRPVAAVVDLARLRLPCTIASTQVKAEFL